MSILAVSLMCSRRFCDNGLQGNGESTTVGRIVQAISVTIEDASQCCTRNGKTPSNLTLYADAERASSYNVPDSSLLPVAMAELAVLRLPSDCSSRASASLARGSTGRLSRPLSEMHSTGCAEAPSASLCSRPCTASRVATRLPAVRRHRSCWGPCR